MLITHKNAHLMLKISMLFYVWEDAKDGALIPRSIIDPLEKEMSMHSGILAWEIPWTEESGGL